MDNRIDTEFANMRYRSPLTDRSIFGHPTYSRKSFVDDLYDRLHGLRKEFGALLTLYKDREEAFLICRPRNKRNGKAY